MDATSTIAAQNAARKTGLSGWIQRHQLLAAYAIVFLLSGSALILLLPGMRANVPYPLYLTINVLTGWFPALAAVVVSAVMGGKAAVRTLLGKFLILRLGLHWYLVGLFLMAAIILGGIGLHVLFGGAMPAIPAATSTSPWLLVVTFLTMIILGMLLNTEEVLWRGFALPRLQSRYGWLAACLLLAVPEILLHVPNFFDPDAVFYRTVGIFWFSAFSVAAVIIYAWIFNHTRGSLVIVTLMHTSQNAWSSLLSDNSLRPFQFTVGLMWLVSLVLIFQVMRSRRAVSISGNS